MPYGIGCPRPTAPPRPAATCQARGGVRDPAPRPRMPARAPRARATTRTAGGAYTHIVRARVPRRRSILLRIPGVLVRVALHPPRTPSHATAQRRRRSKLD